MAKLDLTEQQKEIVGQNGSAFILGAAGTGKTTVVQERLRFLLEQKEPAYTILVLVADPEQREALKGFVESADIGPYSDLKLLHYPQLAREMVQLFWPLVARNAGFSSGFNPPTFLGYDLAQLLMWRTVEPLVEQGAFADLRRRPQQIVSQLLDTLNRSALNLLNIFEATDRQIATWVGEQNHVRNLQLAQQAAVTFRQHCLDNNLLDLSLTVDTFNRHILTHPEFSRYFSERYRHLLVDNVEEQTPAGQAFVEQLMNETESSLIVYDAGGGYKRFLAADPKGAQRFRSRAQRAYTFTDNFISSEEINALSAEIEHFLHGKKLKQLNDVPVVQTIETRYRREMLVALAGYLNELIKNDDVAPDDIAIIVPYLDNALRYTLVEALKRFGIPMNIVRRRASPREEPRVRAWLTWVAVAHPEWDVLPTEYDIAEALELSIADLDPARASLLAAAVYPPNAVSLLPSAELPPETVERVGDEPVILYERLREWLAEHGGTLALDQFIYKLFTDILSSRDFQPEPDLAAAGVIEWLVETASRLVNSAESLDLSSSADIGNAFLTSINRGLITSQPPEMGDPPDPNGVHISTIYGYLLRGRPVRYQVWLETAASGWWDIPRQPLSNAFVLTPSYEEERIWTLAEEIAIRNELLSRVVRGLTARCKDGIILATSDLDRRGQRQDGPLWRALQTVEVEQESFDATLPLQVSETE